MRNVPNYTGPIKSGYIHPLSIPKVISLIYESIVSVDIAFKDLDGRATFDFTIKLNNDFLYVGAIRGPKVFFDKEAEAHAIQHALMRAKNMNLAHVSILSDSKEAVTTLINGSNDWSINAAILDTLNLFSESESAFFDFIFRRLNKVTHILAKVCYSAGHDFSASNFIALECSSFVWYVYVFLVVWLFF